MLPIYSSCYIAAAEIEITLGNADYDDIVDDKATVTVNMGAYETPVNRDNDYCPTPLPPMASAYETPLDTLQKVNAFMTTCYIVCDYLHLNYIVILEISV